MASLRAQFEPQVRAVAKRYGIDQNIGVRQIALESDNFAEDVIYGQRLSPAGAGGIGQFMPATAAQFGIDRFDPAQSLNAWGQHMSTLLKKYRGDYGLALAAYNAGEGNVEKHGGIPPFRETQTYVGAILGGGQGDQQMTGAPYDIPQGGRPQQVGSTEEVLAGIEKQLREIAASGKPLTKLTEVVDPYTGQPSYDEVLTEDGARFNGLKAQRDTLRSGLPNGGVAETLSPNTAASVGAQYAGINENQRQFDISNPQEVANQAALRENERKRIEQDAIRDEETKRANNISATLDILQGEIKSGEINAQEATNKLTAAIQAADIQRKTVETWGGRALPAGSTHFPNLGPSGPVADVARSIGLPFGGFESGGQCQVDPAAGANAINASVANHTAGANTGAAVQRAASAIAAMGVVPSTPGGRAQRPVSQGVA